MGVDLVIYSRKSQSEDFTSYYSRLTALLTDETAMGNILKPLKVSRNSVTVRSASKYIGTSNNVHFSTTARSFCPDSALIHTLYSY